TCCKLDSFFLGRQNELEEVRLKLLEIRGWITAKASTQGPLLAAGLSCLPEGLPGTDVLGSEFGRGVGMPPGGRGRNHAERAAQDDTRRSRFAPCRTPLMVAIRSEKLFQIIICAGQLRHGIAGEESWPVTAGDLPEVHERRFERPRGALVARHRAQ